MEEIAPKEVQLQVHLSISDFILTGAVTAYLRSDGEYQVEHKNRWTNPISDFPGPQYEVDLISIIPQLIGSSAERFYYNEYNNKNDERKIRSNLVNGLHIYIGDNDLHPYMCIPNLNLENLKNMCIVWLSHQALYHQKGIDFNCLEAFIVYQDDDFEKWLRGAHYSDETETTIRDNKDFFMKVKKSSGTTSERIIANIPALSISVE